MLQSETVRKYDTYKDSGIEWIGKIPQNWNVRKLFGLLKSIGSGTTPKGNDSYYDGDIPWLNTGDLTDSYVNIIGKTVTNIAMTECSALKLFDKNSVVIAMYGATIGKLGIITFPTTTNQACCVMSCSKSLYNKYLFYVLYSARDYILTLSYGAGQPNISQETMKSFKLCCPDVVEQQKIADYLDKKCGEIDRVIETEKLVIEKLKEYKQSVITEAVTKGLDKSVPLKDSGIEWIGKIPQHWEIRKLHSLFNFIGGFAFKSDDYVDETENQVIRIGNIRNNNLILDDKKIFITNTIADDALSVMIKCNDILFSMTGTKGKRDYFYTLVVKKEYLQNKNLYLNQRVGCFRKKIDLDERYFNYLLKETRILDSIFIYETGTANQGNLGIETIRNTKLHFPTVIEQQQIADYLDKKCSEIDKAISDKEQVIEKFTEYKKSLIYECVTGKKRV